MDWLTFISSVIGDIAWPLVALAALSAFILKGKQFFRLINSLKYKDFELTTREDFAEARIDAEQLKLSVVR